MGKRQVRLFDPITKAQAEVIKDLEINLIQKNDVTLHGKIRKVQEHSLLFEDSIRRKHTILLADIQEISIDKNTLF